MKKKIFGILLTLMVSAVAFTGCKDTEPFSFYQIGVFFPTADLIEAKPEADRTDQEKQDLIAMKAMLTYLLQNQYIKTHVYNGAIYFMGADEKYNDEQAVKYFNGKKAELDALNGEGLDKILSDAKADAENGLTGTGSITFTYSMTKGSAASAVAGCTASYAAVY